MKPEIINITNPDLSDDVSPFTTVGASMNSWMMDSRQLKQPVRLFDNFWHRYEVAVCFGDSDYDKSILATQLLDCLSRGNRIPGIGCDMAGRPALLVDQQSSSHLLRQRYAPYGREYRFGDNAFRAVIKENSGAIAEIDKRSLPELIRIIERYRSEHGVSIVIVNALSRSVFEGAGVNTIRAIMKALRDVAAKYNLSILVMVPAFKRDIRKPFEPDRHFVARTIMASSDAAFFMGRSCTQDGIGYFRPLKSSVIDLEARKDPKLQAYSFYDSPYSAEAAEMGGGSLGLGADIETDNDGTDRHQMHDERERYEEELAEMEGGCPGSANYRLKPGSVWNYTIRRRDRFIRLELLDVEQEKEHFSKWLSPYKFQVAKNACDLRKEGKTWAEIARRLDMPVSNIRDLLRDGPPSILNAFDQNDKLTLQSAVKILKETGNPLSLASGE